MCRRIHNGENEKQNALIKTLIKTFFIFIKACCKGSIDIHTLRVLILGRIYHLLINEGSSLQRRQYGTLASFESRRHSSIIDKVQIVLTMSLFRARCIYIQMQ